MKEKSNQSPNKMKIKSQVAQRGMKEILPLKSLLLDFARVLQGD